MCCEIWDEAAKDFADIRHSTQSELEPEKMFRPSVFLLHHSFHLKSNCLATAQTRQNIEEQLLLLLSCRPIVFLLNSYI